MSTSFAPTVAHSTDTDPMHEAVARAAHKAGMTVGAWIAFTDRLEEIEDEHRVTADNMRRIPRQRFAS